MASFFDSTVNPVLEGVFGGNTDREDKKAKAALDEALAELEGLESAGLQPIQFEDYKWLGDFQGSLDAPEVSAGDDIVYEGYDPRLAELERVGRSAFNDISVDPRLRDQQTASLEALEEIANSGGHTAADVAVLNRIQSDVAAADRGRRDAIKQGMAQRGMGGSGMELLSLLDSSQAATDRASQAGLDIAGQAQERALNAMLSGGQLAGSIRGQDFGEQAQVAQANDAIDRFNAANANNMSQFNASTWNDAQQFNTGNDLKTQMYNRDMNYDAAKTNAGFQLDADKTNLGYQFANHEGRQKTANANTEVGNQGKLHNQYTLPQQQWDNNLKTAQAKAGAKQAEADYWTGQGNREAGKGASNMQTAATIAMTAAMLSDEREKKDVKPVSDSDVDEFLSAIEPRKYRYKDPAKPGAAEGDRVGFMLQDVQGTKLGDKITRKGDDGTLYYDKDNLDGVILAALSSIAKGRKAS